MVALAAYSDEHGVMLCVYRRGVTTTLPFSLVAIVAIITHNDVYYDA